MAAYIVKLIGHLYDHVWLISTDGDWDTLLTDKVSISLLHVVSIIFVICMNIIMLMMLSSLSP